MHDATAGACARKRLAKTLENSQGASEPAASFKLPCPAASASGMHRLVNVRWCRHAPLR